MATGLPGSYAAVKALAKCGLPSSAVTCTGDWDRVVQYCGASLPITLSKNKLCEDKREHCCRSHERIEENGD